MRKVIVVAIVLFGTVSLRAGQGASSQPQASSSPLTIRVFGGLLGQIEGFCEAPGGTYDWKPVATAAQKCDPSNGDRGSVWLGGALGVRAALRANPPAASDLLVVAGNNQPATADTKVWDDISTLHPHAVGLGRMDFARRLRGTEVSARTMRDFVLSRADLPLLASNVVVRRTGSHVNTVKSRDFVLHVSEDESITWVSSVKIETPVLTSPTAELEELVGGVENGQTTNLGATFKAGDEPGTDSTVNFDQSLRPGRRYRLKIFDAGVERAAFLFWTDSPLTPRADREGYPVVLDGKTSLLTVALVNPDTHGMVATPAWKWKEGDGEHEMVFLDPVKALKTLIAANTGSKDPPRTVLVISDLSDAGTTSLLEEFPQIRFVVLPPDSALLGRAAAEDARKVDGDAKSETRFSGDLGFSSIVDPYYPEATRVMVRPEWVGETLLTIKADYSPSSASMQAQIARANAAVDLVFGAKLVSAPMGNEVQYSAELGSEHETLATAAVYRSCPPKAHDACADFSALWSDSDELASSIGDAMRLRMHADLAVFSRDLIDKDYARYVQDRVKAAGTTEISRFILERLVWDSRRIVKAYVSADDIAGKLKAAMKADDTLCVTGLGSRCDAEVDTDHPEKLVINGRRLAPALFYSIAIPDVLAETLDLTHSDNDGADLVETAHQYFLGSAWLSGLHEPGKTVGLKLENARRRSVQGYFVAKKLDAGWATVTPKDPDGGTNVRKNLGLDFSGAEESKTLTIATDTDWGIIDAQRFAIRVPSTLDYTRRVTPTNTSFDSDEFSIGARFDWKYHNARPFVGYFWEGPLHDHPTSLTASRDVTETRDGFKLKESADFSTDYVARARQYRHWAVGLDFVELSAFPILPNTTVAVRKLGAQWTKGDETNVPTGLTIGGVAQNLDDLISQGDSSLLDAYFKANPDTFSKDITFAVETKTLPVRRFQGDVDGQVKWKHWDRDFTGDLTFRFRHYNKSDLVSAFQLTQEIKLEISLGIPLVWRLKLVPAWTYERATIAADANNVFRYTKLDLKVSLPIVFRYGLGRLIQ